MKLALDSTYYPFYKKLEARGFSLILISICKNACTIAKHQISKDSGELTQITFSGRFIISVLFIFLFISILIV